MNKAIWVHLSLYVVLLFDLTACSVVFSAFKATDTPTPTPTSTYTPSGTPTISPTPTIAPTPTTTPTTTLTPTPPLFVLAGTPLAGAPLPEPVAPITLENASKVSGLTEWHENAVTDVEWMPDGRILAVTNGTSINLYNTQTRELMRTLYPQKEGIVDIAISPSGSWLVSGSRLGSDKKGYSSSVELWLGPNWKPLGILFGVAHGLTNMVFSPDSELFAAAYASPIDGQNHVDFWSAITWTTIGSLNTGPALNLAFSPDNKKVAISPDRYAIRIWDSKEGDYIYTLYTSFTGAVNALVFSPDGLTLASGHYDGVIRLWDMRTGEPFLTFSTDEVIQSLAFSPDGRLLASGGSYQNSLVRIWSAGAGTLLQTLEGHTNGVNKLSFSPDGQYLISASYDGTIRLWGLRPY